MFAQRLQIQERLTDEVADALMRVLEPQGVGVVIEASHLCMMMRGVEKQHSKTVTSALRGCFFAGETRDEFLRLVHEVGRAECGSRATADVAPASNHLDSPGAQYSRRCG